MYYNYITKLKKFQSSQFWIGFSYWFFCINSFWVTHFVMDEKSCCFSPGHIIFSCVLWKELFPYRLVWPFSRALLCIWMRTGTSASFSFLIERCKIIRLMGQVIIVNWRKFCIIKDNFIASISSEIRIFSHIWLLFIRC